MRWGQPCASVRSDVAPVSKPPLLYVLAAFGLVLGGFGTYYAVGIGAPLLQSRDQYVSGIRGFIDKQTPESAAPDRDDTLKLVEKQAEVLYSRRGVALPLAGMNVILSLLLFLGCARAMRGEPWGLSAWGLAAKASIPYVVLDCALSVGLSRERADRYRAAAAAPGLMFGLQLKRLLTLMMAGAQLLYFAVCVLYLRRPSIRALYLPPSA
jgi:hypothetical protein